MAISRNSLKRILLVVALIFVSLVGVVDAAYITWLKVEEEVHEAVDSPICDALSKDGCKVALTSPMATVGPIPISLIGLVTYVVFILLIVLYLQGFKPAFTGGSLQLISLGAVIYSIVLAGYSWAKQSWCPLCVGLYGVNITLFVLTSVLDRRRFFSGIVSGLKSLAGERKLFVGTVLVFALVLGATFVGYRTLINLKMGNQEQLVSRRMTVSLKSGTFPRDVAGAPALGDPLSPSTIIKFSDFECPHCKEFWSRLENFQAKYPGEARLVFRHNPLSSKCNAMMSSDMHKNACAAAYAAECAHQHGRFWEMGSKLFENQGKFSDAQLAGYAAEIGLDGPTFKQCMKDPKTKARVSRDTIAAVGHTINGTPASIVDGHLFSGAMHVPVLKGVVDAIRKRSKDGIKTKTNTVVQRALAILEQKPVKVSLGPLRLDDGAKSAQSTIDLVAFVDPASKAATDQLYTLFLASRVMGDLFRIAIRPISVKADGSLSKMLVCAVQKGKADLAIWHINRNQDKSFESILKELKSDIAGLAACINAPSVGEVLATNKAAATKIGAAGGYVLLVNGRRIDGRVTKEEFSQLIAYVGYKSLR
jgi:protein-disulfide isomerase/uncharacterized membrane protein